MEDYIMNGEKIRKVREKFGVSHPDLARGLGITIPQLIGIENDKIKITQFQYLEMSLLILDFFRVACIRKQKEREAAKEMGNGNDIESDG